MFAACAHTLINAAVVPAIIADLLYFICYMASTNSSSVAIVAKRDKERQRQMA